MGRCHFRYNNLTLINSTLLGTVEITASFWILEIAALLI
jgi:hypothetical protein